MKKCPSCIKYFEDDEARLCQYCGTTLLNTQVDLNAFADTIGKEGSNEAPTQAGTQPSQHPPISELRVNEQQIDNSKLRLAFIRLQSLSEHLPDDDIRENYVKDYHALLDVIQTEIGEDLSPFRIPSSLLVKHLAGIRWGGAYHGYQTKYGQERFCPSADFRIAIHGALDFIATCLSLQQKMSENQKAQQTDLDKPIQKIPFPSPFNPDEIQKQILIYLADPNCVPYFDSLTIALQLHPVRMQSNLTQLVKHGYLTANSFNEWHEAKYRLTEKAVDYLIENDLVE